MPPICAEAAIHALPGTAHFAIKRLPSECHRGLPPTTLVVFSAIATAHTTDLLAAGDSASSALTAGFHRALLAATIFLLAAALIALRTRNARGETPDPEPEPEPELELVPATLP